MHLQLTNMYLLFHGEPSPTCIGLSNPSSQTIEYKGQKPYTNLIIHYCQIYKIHVNRLSQQDVSILNYF